MQTGHQEKRRLAVVTTVPFSLDKLLTGQLRFLNRTFEVVAVSAPGPEMELIAHREGVTTRTVPLARRPKPIADLAALARMTMLFRELQPDIVHAYTPKAGLIAMLAARLTGVPHRIRSINGLPMMEAQGFRRVVLKWMERLSIWASSEVLVNSRSLGDYVGRHLTGRPVGMIGEGSTNGVDTKAFTPSTELKEAAARIRDEYGLPDEAKVICFVGRVVRDKGVGELIEAFHDLAHSFPDLYLMIVGPRESSNGLNDEILGRIDDDPAIVEVGLVEDVRPYMMAADILALPSYREGLPNVLLQGASLGLSMVATDIPGCRDVIRDGETGMLVEAKNSDALREAILTLLQDPQLAAELGRRAAADVTSRFSQEFFWQALQRFYESLD